MKALKLSGKFVEITPNGPQEFKSISALRKITSGKTIYLKLTNGYFMPVVKHQLSRLSEAMLKNGHSFCGTVYPTINDFDVHVELRK